MEQLQGNYRTGLERVAKVVDGVVDHDQRLGSKVVGNTEYQKIMDAHLAGDIDSALSLLTSLIRARSLMHYRIPRRTRILSYGNTHNNKVQLAYFARKTARFRSADIVDLSTCPKDRISSVGRYFCNDLVMQLRGFLLARDTIGKSLIHQAISYSASYCAMLGSISHLRPDLKGVVLANDHSPVPVALSVVCAKVGIKRVYLQHAEVTRIFPPLDFEYSLLMNRRSEQVYRDIGQPSGQIAILHRGSTPDRVGLLDRVHVLGSAQQAVVGVYSSSLSDLDRVRQLVTALQSNASVERVFLKPHPSTDLRQFACEQGIEYFEKVPDIAHVAIVGNSSVVAELAIRGNLVFQDFTMDTVTRDYYGFCRDGLTAEIDPDRLVDCFWSARASDSVLAKAMMDRLDEANDCLSDSEEEEFFRKLVVDLGGVLWPRMSPERQLLAYFNLFPRSFFFNMRQGSMRDAFNSHAAVVKLDSLFNQRLLKLSRLYPHVDCHHCHSIVDFWLVLKRVEWSGYSLDREGVEACWRFVADFQGDERALRWMEARLFDLLLRTCQFDILRQFLVSARYFRMTTAHLNKKMALINVSHASEHNAAELKGLYDPDKDELNDFERLKMGVQCMLRKHGELIYKNYRMVEEAFLAAAQPTLADQYRKFVGTIYERIAGRDTYIDIERDSGQTAKLLQAISDHLHYGRGFSVLRLSDGEGYLFKDTNGFFTEADASNRERHWWGVEIDAEHRSEIVRSGLDTIKSADVIGIPSVYRFVRDHNHKTISLLASLQGRGLVAVLQGVLQYASNAALFGDDKLNRAVFSDRRNLMTMARHARKIVVVSGATESVIKDALQCLGEIIVIPVPTHDKTSSNSRFVRSTTPLPYLIKDIRDRVKSVSAPGTLVLVGAGIAGKSFIHAAKEAGAVGVDLGSAFDYLVDAGINALH